MGVSADVLDFYDDSSKELMAKLAMPGTLSRAPFETLSEDRLEELKDSDFGLVMITKRANVMRKFPVNDPGNAWLSAQYFQANHEKLAFPARFIAAKFIKEACVAYAVPSSRLVDAYAARVEPGECDSNSFVEGSEGGWMLRKLAQKELLSKEAAAVEMNAVMQMPDEHFALVVQTGDGSVIRKYAMPDESHVKKAAAYFDKYAMDFSAEHRHRFASSVKNRAEELGVDVGDSKLLDKWASQNWNQHLDAHLEQRKSLLPTNKGARDVLDKLAASISETDPETMAKALDVFDESTGLKKYYDRGLTDAYASTMDKTATGWSAEVDGHTLTEADLKKVASGGKLKGYLGEAFANQFSKNAMEIFESLPDTEKVLIKQLATGEA